MMRSTAFVLIALALTACAARDDGTITGYAEAEYVYVAPPVAGRIVTVDVQRGQTVVAGASLFTLDPETNADARAEADAHVLSAQAKLADLKRGKRPVEIDAARDQLAQAAAALALSRANLARQQQLVDQHFVSAASLDEVRSAFARDRARVDELRNRVAIARLPGRDDAIRGAAADLAAARAQRAQADWRVTQTRQAAPEAATVADVLVRPGERLGANAPAIALQSARHLKVKIWVPEPQLGAIRLGQRAEGRCDGCAQTVPLVVAYIAPQAEFTPPVLYTREQRARLVHLVELRPARDDGFVLHPGQPIDVRFAANVVKAP